MLNKTQIADILAMKPLSVLAESPTGANELFLTSSGKIETKYQVICDIMAGKYPFTSLVHLNGDIYPRSKKNGIKWDNIE